MTKIQNLNSKLYMGVDESNHGRFPEIFVAAFTGSEQYSSFKTVSRKKPMYFFENPGLIDYHLLLATRSDYDRIPKNEFLGIVIVSLLQDYPLKNFDSLDVFIDGEVGSNSSLFVKEFLSKHYSFQKNRISVTSGADLDRKHSLVKAADLFAHKFFKESTPEKLSQNLRQKKLIK